MFLSYIAELLYLSGYGLLGKLQFKLVLCLEFDL
jgi:hypothetical protein